jgi:hypothetical protein
MMEIDELLREAGERWRAAERPPVVDFPRATRNSGRPRRLVVVALVIAMLAVLAAVIGSIVGGGSRRTVTIQPTTSLPGIPPSQSVIVLDANIAQTAALSVDGRSLWVTGTAPGGGAAPLEHVDVDTGRVLATVKLPDNSPFQIAVGDKAIWVCSQQNEEASHLVKIDAANSRIVAVIPTVGDANVAVTPDAVWVDENTGTLERLDPRTNEVLASIPLPGGSYSAHFITAGPLGIFLANNYDGSVLRVDPDTNTVKVIANAGSSALQPVELDGALWVNTGSGLARINPTTGATTLRIDLGRRIQALASDGRSLWAGTDGPRVVRVDPRTGRTTVARLPAGVKFVSVVAADPATGAVWVASDSPTPRLLRIAP